MICGRNYAFPFEEALDPSAATEPVAGGNLICTPKCFPVMSIFLALPKLKALKITVNISVKVFFVNLLFAYSPGKIYCWILPKNCQVFQFSQVLLSMFFFHKIFDVYVGHSLIKLLTFTQCSILYDYFFSISVPKISNLTSEYQGSN